MRMSRRHNRTLTFGTELSTVQHAHAASAKETTSVESAPSEAMRPVLTALRVTGEKKQPVPSTEILMCGCNSNRGIIRLFIFPGAQLPPRFTGIVELPPSHRTTEKQPHQSIARGGKYPMKTTLARCAACLVAVLVVVVTPGNAAVQENDKTNISLTVFVPCAAGGAGEIVDLSGPLHTLVTFTINGNNVSGKFHFQPQGIRGVGETTGNK